MSLPAVVLAGGRGTRLAGQTPKALVEVEGRPLLWWVLRMLEQAGVREATVATGHRAAEVGGWLEDGAADLAIRAVPRDTGEDAGTAARVRAAAPQGTRFLLAWCDGLTILDVAAMVATHERTAALVTALAVHPPSRFGHLTLEGARVSGFVEKPAVTEAWVSGGVFLVEPGALTLVPERADASWERDVLSEVVARGRMAAHRHDRAWRCLDHELDHHDLAAAVRTRQVVR